MERWTIIFKRFLASANPEDLINFNEFLKEYPIFYQLSTSRLKDDCLNKIMQSANDGKLTEKVSTTLIDLIRGE